MEWISTIFWYGAVPFALLVILRRLIRKGLDTHWGHARLKGIDLRGKVTLVTGASSGVGFEVAVALADRGAVVIVTGRTLKAAKRLVLSIRQRTFLGKLVPFKLELGSLDSISQFCNAVADQFDRLDLLINNAGILMPVTKREKTENNFELHFGVNHLGHFLLTSLLFPLLKEASGRVVIISSISHQGAHLNFQDLMYERTEIQDTSMAGNPLYRQSKLANILFAQELRRRVKRTGCDIKVFVCCPGLVTSNISRNLSLPMLSSIVHPIVLGTLFKTPLQGAQTILHCATVEDVSDDIGVLYRHCKPWNPGDPSFPDDLFLVSRRTVYTDYSEDSAQRLWTESEKLCRRTFDV